MIVTAHSDKTAVNLRVRDEIRALIDQAARVQGRSRSDFMIDAARRAAEDALLDQRLFRVDRGTFDTFLAALDGGPDAMGADRLRATPLPWKS
jgi:uncharacterized protein (DUF1778 family)